MTCSQYERSNCCFYVLIRALEVDCCSTAGETALWRLSPQTVCQRSVSVPAASPRNSQKGFCWLQYRVATEIIKRWKWCQSTAVAFFLAGAIWDAHSRCLCILTVYSSEGQTIPQRAVRLLVFVPTGQQHARLDSFYQLIWVIRQQIGQNLFAELVGTKLWLHTALLWNSLDIPGVQC